MARIVGNVSAIRRRRRSACKKGGVVPRSRSQSNQTSGGSRLTRSARHWTVHRRWPTRGRHAARLDARRQAWARPGTSSRVGRGAAQARRAAEDRQRRRNPHGIRQPPPMQGRPKDAASPNELGMASTPRSWKGLARTWRSSVNACRPLLLKRHVRRHAGPLPRRRCQPRRRQVEGRAGRYARASVQRATVTAT